MFASVTVTVVLVSPTKKTRAVPCPLIVRPGEPAPSIVMLLVIAGSDVARLIVLFAGKLKTITSLAAAEMMACLSDPAPLSLVFVTVNVAAFAADPSNQASINGQVVHKAVQGTPRLMELTLRVMARELPGV
jgi:hypothetical protein